MCGSYMCGCFFREIHLNIFLFCCANRYHACGVVAGKLFCIIVILDYLLYRFLEWLSPREKIDIAPNFPYLLYSQMKDKL